MLSFRNQNQFPSFFTPLGDLLKALIFLLNLNDFNFSSSPPDQRFTQRKCSSEVWKEKTLSDVVTFSLSLPLWFLHYLCVLLSCFWVSLFLCFALFNMFLFVCFQFCFILFFIIIKKFWKIRKIKKECVLCTLVLVYLGWSLKQSFQNFVSFVT